MAAQNGVMKGGRSLASQSLRSRGVASGETRDAALTAAATKRHDADKANWLAASDTLNASAQIRATAYPGNSAWHPSQEVLGSDSSGLREINPRTRQN